MQENGSTSNWVTFFQKPILVPQFLFLSLLLQCFQSPFVLNPSHTSYPFCFPTLISYLCRRATGNARAVYQIYQAEVFPSPVYLADICYLMLYGLRFLQRINHVLRRRQIKDSSPFELHCRFWPISYCVLSSPASTGQKHLFGNTGQD